MQRSEELYQTAHEAINRAATSLERCRNGMLALRQEQSKREELMRVAAFTRELVRYQNEKLDSFKS